MRECVCLGMGQEEGERVWRGVNSSQDIMKTESDDRLRLNYSDNLLALWATGAPFDLLVLISMQLAVLAVYREPFYQRATKTCMPASERLLVRVH